MGWTATWFSKNLHCRKHNQTFSNESSVNYGVQEEFKGTTGVIGIHKSKDKQHNGKEKDKRTNEI
jgi:hypothetical protein